MNQKCICRVIAFIVIYAFPGLVLSTDIWTLAAYRACLENTDTPVTTISAPYKFAAPYNYQTINPRDALECNRQIELIRAALAVQNRSEDRCFYRRTPGFSPLFYVIAEPDNILANCC